MGKESIVEIKGGKYRYVYDDGKTRYVGPVGTAPPLQEEEFFDLGKKMFEDALVEEAKSQLIKFREETEGMQIEIIGPFHGYHKQLWVGIKPDLKSPIEESIKQDLIEEYGVDEEVEVEVEITSWSDHIERDEKKNKRVIVSYVDGWIEYKAYGQKIGEGSLSVMTHDDDIEAIEYGIRVVW